MIVYQQEILLVLVAWALYLYDSAALLYFNEGVLQVDLAQRWHLHLGWQGTTVRGKHVYLPPPLFPHRPAYRLGWSPEIANVPSSSWQPNPQPLLELAPLIWAVAFAVLVLFPLSLVVGLGLGFILATIATLYILLAVLLTLVWQQREALGVTPRAFAGLAFESLVCPPCAINVVRKVSLAATIPDDLMAAAKARLTPEAWAAAAPQLRLRVEDAITQAEDAEASPDSPLARRLAFLNADPAQAAG